MSADDHCYQAQRQDAPIRWHLRLITRSRPFIGRFGDHPDPDTKTAIRTFLQNHFAVPILARHPDA